MKILVFSDIHGSFFYAQKMKEIFEKENGDKLVILGDIYNHGPRNNLPKDYNPLEVSKLLNSLKDKLIVVKGNCDSAVDTMISEFDFLDNCIITSGEKLVFFTHGHIYNKDNMPKTKVDCICYGHFHTGFIEEQNGVIIANAGSISLPKNNTAHSYLSLCDGNLILKDESGKIIKQISL